MRVRLTLLDRFLPAGLRRRRYDRRLGRERARRIAAFERAWAEGQDR